jgi:hypothetical protein
MPVQDKSGALARIRGRTLDIGCGPRKLKAEYVGVDRIDYPGVDVVGDVREVLARIPDGALAGVYSSHFLEHVEDLPGLLDEIARTLDHGAQVEAIVPHFSNPYFYSDPTHRTAFGLYTFSYFAADPVHRRRVPAYVRNTALELCSATLRFKSPHPFYGRYALKRGFGFLVNLTTWTRECYEENFCYLVPCYEIRYVLRKSSAGD